MQPTLLTDAVVVLLHTLTVLLERRADVECSSFGGERHAITDTDCCDVYYVADLPTDLRASLFC